MGQNAAAATALPAATLLSVSLAACTYAFAAARPPAQQPPPAGAKPGARFDQIPGAPPDAFFETFEARDRDAARGFYAKYLEVGGLPVAAAGIVADEALQRTCDIVGHLLAGRPDVLQAMVGRGTRLIVIGRDQVYTDMPEYRHQRDPDYWNERVRGTGGFDVTSFGEENLLTLALDRYDDESIAVHEFCHTIDAALGRIDPTWRARIVQVFRDAMAAGLWNDTYAASNPGEYWAEICQSYFDCNRVNNWNHGPIGTREQLKAYDPAGFELVRSTFRLGMENDWRYRPMRRQPSVIAPPAKFDVPAPYTRFTLAREFIVLGTDRVGDAALLAANEVIRKMFAYRHDILKALIADGVRVVVLGREEHLRDLPEFAGADAPGDDVRFAACSPQRRTIVVPEENVLDPAGPSVLIGLMARALHQVCGLRPVDPEFESRRQKQQYELRVKRLDVEFDHRLEEIHARSVATGAWKGTLAESDRTELWAAAVQVYFDAGGELFPIRSREELAKQDRDLFALVEETFAYRDHVDWRF